LTSEQNQQRVKDRRQRDFVPAKGDSAAGSQLPAADAQLRRAVEHLQAELTRLAQH